MEIKNHSTNQNYFVVVNATAEALTEVKLLVRGNWAKIQDNGLIIVHKNFRDKFQTMARREARNTTIVPGFDSTDEMETWLFDNLNSAKIADQLSKLHPAVFSRNFAGKTVGQLEESEK